MTVSVLKLKKALKMAFINSTLLDQLMSASDKVAASNFLRKATMSISDLGDLTDEEWNAIMKAKINLTKVGMQLHDAIDLVTHGVILDGCFPTCPDHPGTIDLSKMPPIQVGWQPTGLTQHIVDAALSFSDASPAAVRDIMQAGVNALRQLGKDQCANDLQALVNVTVAELSRTPLPVWVAV